MLLHKKFVSVALLVASGGLLAESAVIYNSGSRDFNVVTGTPPGKITTGGIRAGSSRPVTASDFSIECASDDGQTAPVRTAPIKFNRWMYFTAPDGRVMMKFMCELDHAGQPVVLEEIPTL